MGEMLSGSFSLRYFSSLLSDSYGSHQNCSVDLRDFPPNFEREDIAKTFYASMGRTIPLTQSKLFLVGFVRSPSNLVSPKFLYGVRNLSLLVELTVEF